MAEWNCNNCKYGLSEDYTVCMECRRGSKYKEKPILWGDKIRSMSDEELAEFLEQFEVCTHCKYFYNKHCNFENPCVHEFAMAMAYEWLKSEAKE